MGGGKQGQLALQGALHQHVGDQQAIDLVGAFEDPIDALVAVSAFDVVTAATSVATEDLHRLVKSGPRVREARYNAGELELGRVRIRVGRQP